MMNRYQRFDILLSVLNYYVGNTTSLNETSVVAILWVASGGRARREEEPLTPASN